MVASDTVVGLVGAGILLVALVGVFIVESRDTSKELSMERATYSTETAGPIAFSRQQGTTLPVTGICNPSGPACLDAWTNSTGLTLKGLALLPPKLHYVAWLTKANSASPERLGAFSASSSGSDYQLTFTIPKNLRDWTEFHVTLETKAEPTAMSSLMVSTTTFSVGTTNPATVTLAAKNAEIVFSSGTCDVKFNDVASGLQVDVTLDQANNYTGYKYRAWLVKADVRPDENQYVYLNNITAEGSLINATISKGVADLTLADFSEIRIYLEPEDTNPTVDDAEPMGVIAFRGEVP